MGTSPYLFGRLTTEFYQTVTTGTAPVPTQAGENPVNDQLSLQATPPEGKKNVSHLIPIPWDVGNDPDRHKVRGHGATPLVSFHSSIRQEFLPIEERSMPVCLLPWKRKPRLAITGQVTRPTNLHPDRMVPQTL